MLAKCANPSCSAPFRYLEEGRLFRLEGDPLKSRGAEKREYFWLCGACSESMTLRLDESSGVRLVPLRDPVGLGKDSVEFVPLDRRGGQVLNGIALWNHSPSRRNKSPRGGLTRI